MRAYRLLERNVRLQRGGQWEDSSKLALAKFRDAVERHRVLGTLGRLDDRLRDTMNGRGGV